MGRVFVVLDHNNAILDTSENMGIMRIGKRDISYVAGL